MQGERLGHSGEEELDQKLMQQNRVRTEGGAGRTVKREGMEAWSFVD